MEEIRIFDTHCHYSDESFDKDRAEVLAKLPREGVNRICEIGYEVENSKNVLELVRKYSGEELRIHAVVGVHPEHADEWNEEACKKLEELCGEKEVLAVGEIGLDYFHLDKRSAVKKKQDEERRKEGEELRLQFNPEPKVQKECFRMQLELAKKRNLPIVVHSRDAALDTFCMVRDYKGYVNGGIIHCFSYPLEVAKDFVSLGMMLGIGGALTFTNGKKLRRVAEEIPLENIVLETDCPYMAPVPVRGTRNESGNLKYVAKLLAEIKGISVEEVIRKTAENGKKVYRIL